MKMPAAERVGLSFHDGNGQMHGDYYCGFDLFYQVSSVYIPETILSFVIVGISIVVSTFVVLNLHDRRDSFLTERNFIPSSTTSDDAWH